MHSVEGQLKVNLRCGHQHGAGRRDERVRGSEGDTGNDRTRTKDGSKTIDEQIEKKGRENSALCNATKTDLGQSATQETP